MKVRSRLDELIGKLIVVSDESGQLYKQLKHLFLDTTHAPLPLKKPEAPTFKTPYGITVHDILKGIDIERDSTEKPSTSGVVTKKMDTSKTVQQKTQITTQQPQQIPTQTIPEPPKTTSRKGKEPLSKSRPHPLKRRREEIGESSGTTDTSKSRKIEKEHPTTSPKREDKEDDESKKME
ncbi:hypothetical protein EIN_432430 [Entamoeba invadens IP1]|uniref:Uncharacterized protein n=1 Tax=Entamoeba invadens IP1 TaxID=370355 RepID=A0A0A1UCQ2_ENTIV|nr:hypothetical protein EIN_432430 [Entamoeba invadens IP1]ELP93701.1 hypothetical protein EIN_432430 [Entamoeba invadens IP1]|eukprot:XP_004260472.1 hypothetical protein EIN_432430 [Entamoeba invadens IP1]